MIIKFKLFEQNAVDPYGEENWENIEFSKGDIVKAKVDIYGPGHAFGLIYFKKDKNYKIIGFKHNLYWVMGEFNLGSVRIFSLGEMNDFFEKIDNIQENKSENIDPYNEENWEDVDHEHVWEDKVERDPRGLVPPIDYRECKICGKKYRTHVGYGK